MSAQSSLPITKYTLGLGRVDNTRDSDKPLSRIQREALEAHTKDLANPHGVTKAQVGLGNVDNTADMDKPVSRAQASAMDAIAHGVVTFVEQNETSATLFIGSSVDLVQGTDPYSYITLTLYL